MWAQQSTSKEASPVKSTSRTSESIGLEALLYPLIPSMGARRGPGRACSSAASVQPSPCLLHSASAATHITGPKLDVPHPIFELLGSQHSKLLPMSPSQDQKHTQHGCWSLHFGHRRPVPGHLMRRHYKAREFSTGTWDRHHQSQQCGFCRTNERGFKL